MIMIMTDLCILKFTSYACTRNTFITTNSEIFSQYIKPSD